MNLGTITLNENWQLLNGLTLTDINGDTSIFTVDNDATYTISNNDLGVVCGWDGDTVPTGNNELGSTKISTGECFVYKTGQNPLYLKSNAGSGYVKIEIRDDK